LESQHAKASAGHHRTLSEHKPREFARNGLGPEFARKPLSVRKRIEASQEAYRERLLPFVPGQTREEKLAKFQLLFPSMAGVLTAARVKSSHPRA
jgi:hypothetical protein